MAFHLLDQRPLERELSIRFMGLKEIVLISTLSKKAKKAVINSMRCVYIQMNVIIYGDICEIKLKTKSGDVLYVEVVQLSKKDKLTSMVQFDDANSLVNSESDTTLSTHWKNTTEGLKKLLKHLGAIFHKLSVSLKTLEPDDNQLAAVLEFINYRNPRLDEIRIEDVVTRDSVNYVSVESLVKLLDCNKLFLSGTPLSSNHLNLILKNWTKDSRRAREMTVNLETIDTRRVLHSLPIRPIIDDKNDVAAQFEIRQENGATARIFITNSEFTLNVTN